MNLILAADENWAIGYRGGLLCHLSGDLKYFKKLTTGNTVIMGRVTLESLPGGRGLPNRRNIVITRQADFRAERVDTVIHSPEELADVLEPGEQAFVIGGAEIYEELLPRCGTCFVTRIHGSFPADRWFRNLDEDPDFRMVWHSDIMEENGIEYQFCRYERQK